MNGKGSGSSESKAEADIKVEQKDTEIFPKKNNEAISYL